MTPPAVSESDTLTAAAMALPAAERAALADRLLASLGSEEDREIERAWAREAEDRLTAHRRGELSTIPDEMVAAELARRVGR